jgi:hypothetical protein
MARGGRVKDPEFPAGVIVRGRRAGKTTACLEWLTRGHPVKNVGRNEWSRLLIVTDNRMLEQVLRRTLPRWHEIDHLLQQRGLPQGLAGCVISAEAFRVGRGRLRGQGAGRRADSPEIMVDDADLLIQQALGFWPDYLVVTGRPFDPDGEPDPWEPGGYRMANGTMHQAWYHEGIREMHFHHDAHYASRDAENRYSEWLNAAEDPYAGWTDEQRRRLYEGRWEPATEEDIELRHGLGSPDAAGGEGDLEPPAHDGPGEPPVRSA